MKIRSYLVLFFLLAAIVPTLIFSVWSYRDTVSREFEEVRDRHLLLARKAAGALDRYQRDLVFGVDAAAMAIQRGDAMQELGTWLQQLDIKCLAIVDKTSGGIFKTISSAPFSESFFTPALIRSLGDFARFDGTEFTNVKPGPDGSNAIFLIKDLGDHVAVAAIAPDYIIELGKSITFGEEGHAAIVDRAGNVIAHPKPDWIEERRNLSEILVVAQMMRGETGIGEFYSPSANKNMIAGFTTVPGPGWGVMVPQPVSEIYAKAKASQSSLGLIMALAVLSTLAVGAYFARSLSRPIENLARVMHDSTVQRKLAQVTSPPKMMHFLEVNEVCASYNRLVDRMTTANRKIEKLAFTDQVTGLPNRGSLLTLSSPILERATSAKGGGILLLIDLDNFKEINDLLGHDAGDQHLQACAQALETVAENLAETLPAESGASRETPIAARIGGDEFIMVVKGAVDDTTVKATLEAVRSALAAPAPNQNVMMSASVGCARFPKDGRDLEELIKRADIAMYHAKSAGKNRTQIYTPLLGTKSAAEIRRDLMNAMENGELYLEYQPKICTRRRKVISVEALARWDHPEIGLYLPKFWVPVLMGSHTMNRLGEWVVAQAMRDLEILRSNGHDLWMSVNIGSDHFVAPDFIETVEAIQKEQGFDRSLLEIEVTEDALFTSEQRAIAAFNGLHDLGYRISIDDFGSGYSNITRLASLPVDFLKIDQSIISAANQNARARTILASTITMATDLGCFTVAEGIETDRQAEFATLMGANCLQGFYFTPSLPMDELSIWLNEQNGPQGHSYLRADTEPV
ncbi:EAL domain-containing protein [Roseibium denhamense]|uniref:Diguanylate cyclase (GGDEF) domain-containing protein n=1 Tax=Roseibium denhamense TaxID=76305 RepID=A0ABY1NSV2_9HYPH|nr:EAL domain-containing protein [Roseibium denhamense]MTI05353.1 EAL domain-containing protein [Roseibium denhamense]SMP17277.1 diguanylate cyclase (GGDEF) domain-containing protein [Roseibium denhamense]